MSKKKEREWQRNRNVSPKKTRGSQRSKLRNLSARRRKNRESVNVYRKKNRKRRIDSRESRNA